jgi:hypothetical protein
MDGVRWLFSASRVLLSPAGSYGNQPTAFLAMWRTMYTTIKAQAPRTIIVWAPNTGQGCVAARAEYPVVSFPSQLPIRPDLCVKTDTLVRLVLTRRLQSRASPTTVSTRMRSPTRARSTPTVTASLTTWTIPSRRIVRSRELSGRRPLTDAQIP